ncbi:hypothetical protein RQP46_002188 [Phenoliferia psychrophenolica]
MGGTPFETSQPFDAHIGPLMFGAHGSMVLTGVIWCQTVAYFNRFQNKREPATKALIAGLALLFTIKLIVDSLWMYEYFVYNFGNGAVFGSSPPTFQIGAWLSTVPAILCQIWLLLRVYVASLPFLFLVAPLYFMSVLYTLNAREKPVEDLSQDYTTRSLQCTMPSARLTNSFHGQETARSTTLCNPEFAIVRMDSDLSDDHVEKLAERDGTLHMPL